MKTEKRILLTVLLTMTTSLAMNAQSNQTVHEAKLPPQASEVVAGIVTNSWDGGVTWDRFEYRDIWGKGDLVWCFVQKEDHTINNYTEGQFLRKLVEKATLEYGKSHPNFLLRDFTYSRTKKDIPDNLHSDARNMVSYTWIASASVVFDPNFDAWNSIFQALNKSLCNVREGSRLAIDQVSVPYSIDRNAFKDQIIDVLLDNGYKVVAKEYLEKLYQELQDQQSGIYNDRTTVQENNFSAVGYFLNIKLTESSVRVQVVNVSTGEYEGNATVNF